MTRHKQSNPSSIKMQVIHLRVIEPKPVLFRTKALKSINQEILQIVLLWSESHSKVCGLFYQSMTFNP